MDTTALATGLTLAKSGFDTLRAALGLVKDVQGVLPAGDKKDAVARSLDQAERQLRTAEAQIAQGLGYQLCRCAFPPTPMLQVGYWAHQPSKKNRPVHECPNCNCNDAPLVAWTRTAPEGAS